MASKIGLGVPMPMMLPVTGLWTAPFAAYYLFLQNRIVYHRLSNKAYLGDRCQPDAKATQDPLYMASRAQINFIENVPLAFLFAAVAELNGADRKWLNITLATFLGLRVAHSELGIMMNEGIGFGRIVGFYGTQLTMLGLASWTAYLVKGYWGF